MGAKAAAALPQLEPGSFRKQVFEAARRFKSSWVELAALLVKVRDDELYTEWGFASFEAYCAKEVHIKRGTALKLTGSYSFLQRHERGRLEDGEQRERMPSFEVVSALAGAEERGQLSADEYREVRDEIWGGEQPSAVLRTLNERYPAPEPAPEESLRRLAGTATRLARELAAHPRAPKVVAERAAALAEDLQGLL